MLEHNNTLTLLDVSGNSMGAKGAASLAEGLKANTGVQQLNVNSNAMGTTAAKAFGGMLPLNKTLQTLDVSNNSFGKPAVGEQVKLKSSGEMCTLTMAPDRDNKVKVTKADGSQSGYMKWHLFEWESQVPALCAGLAASQCLLSVSD
jgi:hypothetical protein